MIRFRQIVGMGLVLALGATAAGSAAAAPAGSSGQALTRRASGRGDAVTAGTVRAFTVAGVAGIPADAAAVALNVTAVDPLSSGYLTLFPCGEPLPETSTLNFGVGRTTANSAIARPGAAGQICVYASATADVLVDATGWFSGSGSTWSARPERLVDTRLGLGAPRTRLQPGAPLVVQAAPAGDGTTAVVLNVTAVNPSTGGYVTAYTCGQPVPPTSNLNFSVDGVVANLVIATPADDGTVCLLTSAATDLIVDRSGRLGAAYTPVTPYRAGVPWAFGVMPLPNLNAEEVRAFTVPEARDATAVLNVTVTRAMADGYLVVYGCQLRLPPVSNVNFVRGVDVANQVIVHPDSRGQVCLYASAGVQVIVDGFGWLGDAFTALASPVRLGDTRNCAFTVVGERSSAGEGDEITQRDTLWAADRASGERFRLEEFTAKAGIPAFTRPILGWDCWIYAVFTDRTQRPSAGSAGGIVTLRRYRARSGEEEVLADLTEWASSHSLRVMAQDPVSGVVYLDRSSYLGGSELMSVDPATGSVTPMAMPQVGFPSTMDMSRRADRIFASLGAYVTGWMTVVEIDPRSGARRPIAAIPGGPLSFPLVTSPDGHRAIAGSRGTFVIDQSGNVEAVQSAAGWTSDGRIVVIDGNRAIADPGNPQLVWEADSGSELTFYVEGQV